MTDGTSGAGTAYPSGAPELTPRFQRGSCCAIFGLICNVIKIVVCPFLAIYSWSLCCLSFELRILITLWDLQTILNYKHIWLLKVLLTLRKYLYLMKSSQ